MKLCVLVTFNLAPADFWERIVEDLPPEARRPGPVELPPVDPAVDPAVAPAVDPLFPFTTEITRWEEGRVIALRMRGPWFLREINMRMAVESYGLHWTRVLFGVRLRTVLDLPLRIIYRLFRAQANRLIIRELAAMRHEAETGQEVTDDNRASVRLDDIEVVRCRRRF